MWTGEPAPPPGAAAQIFNLSRCSFALGRNRRILWILRLLPPLQFPLKSFGFPGAETARKRFLLWEMGFPDAKISCDSVARGDFADFPNRQNRSALADLKTLWVFNLLAGDDFYARGLRPSRALPGGQTGCLSLKKWGFISESTASLPGTFFSRGLWPSRALSADWQTGVFFRETILTRGLRLFRIFLRFGQTKRPRKPFAEALQTVWKNCASCAFGVTARPSGQAASATRRCP